MGTRPGAEKARYWRKVLSRYPPKSLICEHKTRLGVVLIGSVHDRTCVAPLNQRASNSGFGRCGNSSNLMVISEDMRILRFA